jgi:hypothetical protein
MNLAQRMATVAGSALVLAMALVTPSQASTDGGARFDTGHVATAATAPASTNGTVTRTTLVPADGRVSCYGYYGTFKPATYVIVIDWVTASDECFGITADRRIWHTWPGSGGWKVMPGNGHADLVNTAIVELGDGTRGVSVFATTNGTTWCQNYYPDNRAGAPGWTGDWYLC